VIFLVNLFDEETTQANNLSIIQYYKKPFTQRGLISTISSIIKNDILQMRHLRTADLLLLLSIIKNRTALCLLNKQNGDSGEIFIDTKSIRYASVEKNEIPFDGQLAFKEILKWESFESRYSDATFPNDTNVINGSLETIYEFLQLQRHEQVINNEYKSTISPEQAHTFSAEAQQRLRELLAHVPQKVNEGFMMNAFCNSNFKILAQLKNPRYNECLYRIGDFILEGFKNGIGELRDGYENYFICDLPDSNFMGLHQIDEDILYFTILNNKTNFNEDVHELVNSFSNSIPSILDLSQKSCEYPD